MTIDIDLYLFIHMPFECLWPALASDYILPWKCLPGIRLVATPSPRPVTINPLPYSL